MERTSTLTEEDLEAAVDLVYEVIVKQGVNRSLRANHQLMDEIKELDLGQTAERYCWNRIWKKYGNQLVELGYIRGW